MKLIVTGFGRHGKDTVCEHLKNKYGLTYESSSMYCARLFIAERLGYNTPEEAYRDRHNHRQQWHDLIHEYNRGDLARLGREMLSEYDIYCGLRNHLELEAIQREGLVDATIWVDRTKKVPPESSTSITPEMCDHIIDNNGTLEELYCRVSQLYAKIQANQN